MSRSLCLVFLVIFIHSSIASPSIYHHRRRFGKKFLSKGKFSIFNTEFRHLNTISKSRAGICSQAMSVGPCRANVKRYFFDETSGECVPFTYGGCHGNANNFATKQKCTEFCGNYKTGGVVDNSLEKYHRYKRCFMQDDSGPCNSKLPRWFFNAKTSDCELFFYGGCQGNRNNFGSKKSCLMKCHPQGLRFHKRKNTIFLTTPPPFPIPETWEVEEENDNNKKVKCYLPLATGHCKAFHRMFYYDAELGRCRPFVYGGCGGNQNRFAKEIECENSCVDKDESGAFFDPADMPQSDVPSRRARHVVETCELPPESGPCRDVIKRFYFDATSGKCHQFYYGGCKGNENNFPTRRDCKRSCKRKMRSKSASDKPSFTKNENTDGVAVVRLEKDAVSENLPNADGEKRFHPDDGSTSMSSKDPLEYDYHFEREMEKNAEDEVALRNDDVIDGVEDVIEDDDDASRVVEVDNSLLDRRADDAVTLESLDENQVSKRPSRCLHVPESGSGKDIIKNYFFNVESEKCERFYYSGKGGNENRFESLHDCQRLCAS